MKIIDTAKSAYAKLDSFDLEKIGISNSFWAPKIKLNSKVSIPHQFRECERTGRVANFRKAAGLKKGAFKGCIFNDSDLHKLMEAAALDLAALNNQANERIMKECISLFARAQRRDGYLCTPFILDSKKKKWSCLEGDHEIYTAGHMIQAAIAHHRATGKTGYLKIAEKWAKGACAYFGPRRHHGTCGHPEAEMALIELYRETGKREYLKLGEFFLKERGKLPYLFKGNSYFQDHLPIHRQKTVVGHAVRQLYLLCGEADLYAETGDKKLLNALRSQWNDFTNYKMYITGGAGSNYPQESFEEKYYLPNKAYAETCASIASFMWNRRMFFLEPSAKYTDLMETAMYNGILSGVSLDGKKYFYANPLEHKGIKTGIIGSNRRTSKHWDGCACCPPNAARFFSYMRDSIYSYAKDSAEIYVNFYAAGRSQLSISGVTVEVTQQTDYPWSGKVLINVAPMVRTHFTIKLRIPAWARSAEARVNGKTVKNIKPGNYLSLERIWAAGDVIELSLPMQVERIKSSDMVASNSGCIALKRGPVVYCIESADFGKANIFDIILPSRAKLKAIYNHSILGGVIVLKGKALLKQPRFGLYNNGEKDRTNLINFTAIPYYSWANRRPGMMRVWIPER